MQLKVDRYQNMTYRRVGKSGLKLSAIGLGFWHNFGSVDPFDQQRAIIKAALDLGITYFDLANNYGPTPGSAEENLGRLLRTDLKPYRDELVIATKAGYHMWEGPYGEWGSKKSIIASADQSLTRLGLDYVDIFYSHRPDPETPFEETALALDQLVHQGKALYIGISNYSGAQAKEMATIFDDLKTPYIVCQNRYNLFNRQVESDLFPELKRAGKAMVAFSPLCQGLLTNKYLNGIPADSRAAKTTSPFLHPSQVEQTLATVKRLNQIASDRGQTLAEMALSWDLRSDLVDSVIAGASRPEQLVANVMALNAPAFTADELTAIDAALAAQAEVDWSRE